MSICIHLSSRKSTPDSYTDQLISEGVMTEEERGKIKSTHYSMLNDKLANMTLYSPPPTNLQGRWGGLVEPGTKVTTWDTGVPASLLQYVGAKSVDIPQEIQLHSHLGKMHVQVKGSLVWDIAILLLAVRVIMYCIDNRDAKGDSC